MPPSTTKLPIPLLSYGKAKHITVAVASMLAPEYEVVHACIGDFHTAISEIPLLLSGSPITPKSNIGSNVSRPPDQRLIPKVVMFGGGIDHDEVRMIKDAVSKRGGSDSDVHVKWIRVDREEIARAGGPSAEVVVPILRRMLGEAGL